MRKFILAIIVMVAMAVVACTPAQKTEFSTIASQAAGAVKGLVAVAKAAPLSSEIMSQVDTYGSWAGLAVDALTGVSTAMSAPDAVTQGIGAAQAVNTLIQNALVDASVKSAAGGWSSWAVVALQAASTILPLVL